MPRDFFDPTPEQQNVIFIDAAILRKAERLIESCEYCNEEEAQIPFDNMSARFSKRRLSSQFDHRGYDSDTGRKS